LPLHLSGRAATLVRPGPPSLVSTDCSPSLSCGSITGLADTFRSAVFPLKHVARPIPLPASALSWLPFGGAHDRIRRPEGTGLHVRESICHFLWVLRWPLFFLADDPFSSYTYRFSPLSLKVSRYVFTGLPGPPSTLPFSQSAPLFCWRSSQVVLIVSARWQTPFQYVHRDSFPSCISCIGLDCRFSPPPPPPTPCFEDALTRRSVD